MEKVKEVLSSNFRKNDNKEFSKRLIQDIRALLWVVTVGGLLLAAYCVRVGYMGGATVAFSYGGPAMDRPRDCMCLLSQHG